MLVCVYEFMDLKIKPNTCFPDIISVQLKHVRYTCIFLFGLKKCNYSLFSKSIDAI